jgi:hypothetical protein
LALNIVASRLGSACSGAFFNSTIKPRGAAA